MRDFRPEIQNSRFVLRRYQADRGLVNAWLRDALRFGREVPVRLARAMRYAVLGPGKRVRPVLALESFRAAKGRDEEHVRPFCCGIEMIHAFSLVHDDLPSMDNDDFRRGRPSLHRKYDEAVAILAADALFAYAFQLFSFSPAPRAPRLAAIQAISRAVGPAGMAGGQMLDIATRPGLSRPGLERLHRKKTADFMAAALVAGAALARVRTRVLDRLWEAGRALGLLFQVTDDLLDAEQESDGKRMTRVSRYGREGTLKRAVQQAHHAEQLFRSLGPGYDLLAGFPRLILERTS